VKRKAAKKKTKKKEEKAPKGLAIVSRGTQIEPGVQGALKASKDTERRGRRAAVKQTVMTEG